MATEREIPECENRSGQTKGIIMKLIKRRVVLLLNGRYACQEKTPLTLFKWAFFKYDAGYQTRIITFAMEAEARDWLSKFCPEPEPFIREVLTK